MAKQYNWQVVQSGRTTVTKANFEFCVDATTAIEQFVAGAEPDPSKRRDLVDAVLLAEHGEPVELPNGKKLELIDLGNQF